MGKCPLIIWFRPPQVVIGKNQRPDFTTCLAILLRLIRSTNSASTHEAPTQYWSDVGFIQIRSTMHPHPRVWISPNFALL